AKGRAPDRIDGIGAAPDGQHQRRPDSGVGRSGQVPTDVLQPGHDARLHRRLARVRTARGRPGQDPRVRRRRLHDADPAIRVVGSAGSARAGARPGDAGGALAHCPRLTPRRQLGMQAVTVISMSSSGEFSDATVTVVRAGLLVGKYFAYSSLYAGTSSRLVT